MNSRVPPAADPDPSPAEPAPDHAETIALFMSEACPELALALHRIAGHGLAILWDDGTLDDFGEGPEPTPVHVFVIDPATGEAIDIKGRRPVQDVCADFGDLLDPNVDYQVTEPELLALMGDTRPFYAQDAHTRARPPRRRSANSACSAEAPARTRAAVSYLNK